MACADRADLGVGRLAKGIVVAGAEHLCLRIHLGMHLKADDGFQCFHPIRVALLCVLSIFDFLI